MRRPASLALRLTVSLGVLISLAFLAFGWLIQRSIENHFKELDAAELAVLVHSTQDALLECRGNVAALPMTVKRLAEASVGHHGIFLHVAGADGRPVFSSADIGLSAQLHAVAPVDQIDPATLQTWRAAGHHYRGTVLKLGMDPAAADRPFLVLVAKSMDMHMSYLAGFHQALWLTALGSILIAFVVVWWVVQRGHAPLRRITAEIRQTTSDRLNVRLSPGTVPIELAELAASFNEMLERIEESFGRLANFSADIAHELRTPITNLMTQTQVALSNARSIEEYREILYSNLEEYERMAQMVGDMLFLAKTDNGQLKPSNTRVDLTQEIQELFEYFEAWAEERGVHLALAGTAPAVTGDRLMLRRAISNLLSNAIRHTAHGNAVTVRLTAHGDYTSLTVENPGDEIPTAHLPRLFDRFYRPDPSRQRDGDGAGLGLSIVKSIITAHGGTVEASWSDGSVRFRLTLPNRGTPD
ncbi:MAG: heavy metal sensor histidine kinase [Gammaproteobacteria bacterium]|nr:heavy metal sensor histidine kinase [Rhodocyclaceae bacterium]MBU3909679.1 heavy metal sensor histidine kinase [Gammaproteobacteria bacterium]MBU3988029.1 heavy metal sensor histidine kinase [Gammaproteobacteria bacterium]MBU4005212.1 heavy metal sensor histidine kinase [Gammaproteobacteria bacterium]MBU4022391.1 heavy metal sensor histidine kinase [Gammaproteobacteria bacterium]